MLRILRILNVLQDNQRRSCRCGTSKEVGRKKREERREKREERREKREERREKREERRDENADHPIIRSSDRNTFCPAKLHTFWLHTSFCERIGHNTHYTLHITHSA
jgi:hypothetical protein